MNTHVTSSPFHAGERQLQSAVGKREAMEKFGRQVIRSYMPDQHREFYTQLPFLVIGRVDAQGNPWASLLAGAPGFVTSPDPQHLRVTNDPTSPDPVTESMRAGEPLGLLGIELPTRRRNRMNGRLVASDDGGFTVRVDQAFGNCPQYIASRVATWTSADARVPVHESFKQLPEDAVRLIEAADTFFVASSVPTEDNPTTQGVDVSHRGGQPGFVQVEGNTLTIPDFAGNNHFNTLGNFVVNPRAGLVFVDFVSGSLLQVTGSVEILDAQHPQVLAFAGAERAWRVTISHGRWLKNVLPLRFGEPEASPSSVLTDTWQASQTRLADDARAEHWHSCRVVAVVDETSLIRSFYLKPVDGRAVTDFQSGQHLPIRIGDQPVRTYTLSSGPGKDYYRISVKREDAGEVSRYLHDQVRVGDVVEARAPAGKFVLDRQVARPVLLIGGGVGITPMIAMAAELAQQLQAGSQTKSRAVTVVQVARTALDMAFANEFKAMAVGNSPDFRYFTIATQPRPDDPLAADFVGRLHADMLRNTLPLDDYDVYVCGPGGFMQHTYRLLRGLGIADERIHTEAFGPSTLQRDKPQASSATAEQAVVRFTETGIEEQWHAQQGSLLDFAEQQGLNPPFSCRGGSCGSCATRLLKGQAINLVTGATSNPGDEVLICSAVPAASPQELELQL